MATNMMTLKEAAERYGFKPASLRKAANRRTLNAERMGRDWLVTAESVERYIAQHAGKAERRHRIRPK